MEQYFQKDKLELGIDEAVESFIWSSIHCRCCLDKLN